VCSPPKTTISEKFSVLQCVRCPKLHLKNCSKFIYLLLNIRSTAAGLAPWTLDTTLRYKAVVGDATSKQKYGSKVWEIYKPVQTNTTILPAPVDTTVMTSRWRHPCVDLVSKNLWNMSEICETCLKLVKNYLLFNVYFIKFHICCSRVCETF
jgi:hypothetical protein